MDLPDLEKDSREHVIKRLEYFIKAVNEEFETEVGRYQTVVGLTEESAKTYVPA